MTDLTLKTCERRKRIANHWIVTSLSHSISNVIPMNYGNSNFSMKYHLSLAYTIMNAKMNIWFKYIWQSNFLHEFGIYPSTISLISWYAISIPKTCELKCTYHPIICASRHYSLNVSNFFILIILERLSASAKRFKSFSQKYIALN